MNNRKYIEQIKAIVDSSIDRIERIEQVAALILPEDADPLVSLIHGDAQQLEHDTDYAKNYDPAAPNEQEIRELREHLAAQIEEKIKKYLADWDANNFYYYTFSLRATYGAFKNKQGDKEFIDIIKHCFEVKTIKDAVRAATQWESQLLERIVLYEKQEIGHKQISVKPIYTISDTKLNRIASGVLEFDDEDGISTWLNQI